MIFIYRFLTIFFYPIFIILIYFRKLLNKEDHYRYKEKIFPSNFSPDKDNNKKLIWFHAASIGEVQSIFPLIQKLNDEKKNLEFLITTVTLSAGNIVKKKLKKYKNIKHRYFPLDVNFLIKSFLNKWKPDLIIFIDSEIWPNLIFEIKNPNKLIISGSIRVYCNIPINAEIKTIGNKTLKKNGGCLGSINLKPPNTKLTPTAALANK